MKPLWGLLAEFDGPDALLRAARAAYREGYRKMDAYSPFPIPNLAETIGLRRDSVPLLTLVGGLIGGGGAYILQYWINVIAFPINVGGRPLHAWPSFIPVTFEMTVLFASFGAFFGMWALNRLPAVYHPLFNSETFAAASRDRFFLCIETVDPLFELDGTREFLLNLKARLVEEVPND
ncbi:MAG TPA: DUF3341 domain-containing protein [Terriglobales bacterium]|jgi:hypothetical protein|nr:DUF3341 domain-containing protein [Terriglobales bacterium]